MSIQVATTRSPKGQDLDEMNKRAHDLGLIATDSRILTIEDASTLMGSAKYRELADGYEATEETMVLKSAPKNIPVGSPELIEYAASQIHACTAKKPVVPPSADSSLQL
ncbi:Uncharacterised protein [Legionella steigerwaltii]|uniref:Uncharacterized protein n=1 Tax=Legionella steigerwaltii TaxID=460 RepID=A0A378L6J2_9GAMM|nr:hypothetical protein [Legionella steigerwaltii]KTD79452.1 hypothetical protein Lstg_0668 [Legionella steigerwaltii]STY21448.1 Uncharacterised protein [Legionella steigerwaltii]